MAAIQPTVALALRNETKRNETKTKMFLLLLLELTAKQIGSCLCAVQSKNNVLDAFNSRVKTFFIWLPFYFSNFVG
jgi:hypothetical protein